MEPPLPKFPLPASIYAYGDDLCNQPKAFPGYEGAAPYDVAPHPIVFTKSIDHDGDFTWSPELPQQWTTEDVAMVQLVGCVNYRMGLPIRDCSYDGEHGLITVTLRRAEYTISVYAAATGELLRSSTIKVDHSGCPFAIFGQSEALPADAPSNQIQEAFKDLIYGRP